MAKSWFAILEQDINPLGLHYVTLPRSAVIAITKHGIEIARKIKTKMPEVEVYVPAKLNDGGTDITWFSEQSTQLVGTLFRSYDALVCVFSLGAVIRMVSPYLVNKKSDPAVVVIDDRANHVISALSGHLGGANALARLLATILGARPVITTAADVNETIAVDLIGREYGWTIENFENVTKTSAFMVNEESIALFQDAGEKDWWRTSLPKNVTIVNSIEEVKSSGFKAGLVITDRVVADSTIVEKSVIYRPKTLVVGIGLHFDTDYNTIETGIARVFQGNGLALSSIRNLASVNRGARVKGLDEFAQNYKLSVQFFEKAELVKVEVPNPSDAVQKFEGTASVSEAASLLSSGGELIVQKTKFPPNLTVAVCRIKC